MNRATYALGIALCTMMSIGAVAAHPATPPPDSTGSAGPVGYGGKITALRPSDRAPQPGGPADGRSITNGRLPAALPVFGPDVNIAGGNETTIAANPANPLNFLAGANSNGRFTTTDGGLTWNVGSLAGGGDPAVAFDAAGNAYFAELGNTSGCPDIPRVYKSTDGGLTFGPAVNTLVDPSPLDHFIDKEWMGVDTSPASPHLGRIYYTATNFHTPPGCNLNNYIDNRIQLTYSDDQGATWSAPITVSDASHDQNQFSLPRIASDGTLYVGYQYQNCTFNCAGIPAYQMLAKSTDGGLTFSPSITITGAAITYTGPSVAGYQYLYAGSTSSGFRHNDQEVIEVSPTNPNQLYAVWSDGRFESSFVYQGVSGQHADIVFTRSTDGGLTWTAPVKINDDAVQGKDQFFPWQKVGSDGTIHVSWMDRRDAPVDGFPYREYYTQSTDGGLTWSANQAVADVGGVPGTFIGDYSGIAVNAANSLVLPIWTDSRNGTRAYTDRGVIGNPPATATATTVPPSATATTVPPSATSTAVPPSATSTAVPPSATSTATATATTVPP
ncbi:MAG: glycoside hydrolase, partial [Chloroflexota bacterium]|nr:glycoside hydrolase [Chloroflexota bacterium]